MKAQLVFQPEDWPYSNYLEWIGQRAGTLKDETFIRDYFPTLEAYRQFVADYQDELRVREHIKKYIWD